MKIKNTKSVLVGMSGGVDSSVAAMLLLNQGYKVTGVTLRLRSDENFEKGASGGCCSLEDIDDARRVAYALGIDHIVLNFTDIFEQEVIKYFIENYQKGCTPNPCIACNNKIKFNYLLNKAKSLDFNYIATGHYSKIEYDNNLKRYILKKSGSLKDQSYVLYNMTQDQLASVLFPLGDMQKSEVRKLAEKNNLPVANKPDSQEICFIVNKKYFEFIEEYTKVDNKPGNFIDKNNKILGRHKGVIKYTVGQRKGLNISFNEPRYVIKIDSEKNLITLGKEEDLYKKRFITENLNFILFDKLTEELEVQVKIRYQAKPALAIIRPEINKKNVEVEFKEPQRAVTPGQAAVFYLNDLVIGGGIIKSLK